MSTTTAKVVMFNMEIGETPSSEDEHVDHNKLEEMVKELSQSLTGMHFPKLLPDHFQFLLYLIQGDQKLFVKRCKKIFQSKRKQKKMNT